MPDPHDGLSFVSLCISHIRRWDRGVRNWVKQVGTPEASLLADNSRVKVQCSIKVTWERQICLRLSFFWFSCLCIPSVYCGYLSHRARWRYILYEANNREHLFQLYFRLLISLPNSVFSGGSPVLLRYSPPISCGLERLFFVLCHCGWYQIDIVL